MRNRLTALALLAILAVAPAALAQEGISRATGFHLTFPATNETANFEFQATAVEICTFAGQSRVYARFGTSMTSLDGLDTSVSDGASSNTIFQEGNSRLAGRALVFTHPNEWTESHCRVYPFITRGMVFQTDTASGASLDVNAFSNR